MSVKFDATGERLKRTTNIAPPSGDYTCAFYVRSLVVLSEPDYQTLFLQTNDIVTQTQYVGIYNQGDNNIAIYIKNAGGTQVADGAGFQLVQNKWYYITYTRSGNSHKFYINGAQAGSTLTLDISANTWAEQCLGDDTFSVSDLEVAYFREWTRALTPFQINQEFRSTVLIGVTDQWADTPLRNDLLDDSGNGYNWTAVGSTSFTTQVTTYRWTDMGFGASFRMSPLLLGNPYTVSSDGAIMFIVSVGTTAFELCIAPTSSTTTDEGVVLSSNWEMRLRIYESIFTSTPTVSTVANPFPDPMIGGNETGAGVPVREEWGWHQIEVKMRTSTRDSAGNFSADGSYEIKLDGAVIFSRSAFTWGRSTQWPFTNFTYCPVGDGDGFFVLSTNTYPTSYSGSQNVPVSPFLIEYLNFNSGTSGPGWTNTRTAPVNGTGPYFNPTSGLSDTGSASPGSTDPTEYATWSPTLTGGGENLYGSLFKALTLISPEDTFATIIVTKTVISSESDETEFEFDAGGGLSPSTFTLQDGESQTFENIEEGTYSISEDPVEGYNTVITVSNGDDPDAITIAAGEVVTVSVVNTRTSTLTIRKVTNNPTSQEFDINVDGPSIDDEDITLGNGGEQVYEDIAAGTYSVVETVPEDWSVGYSIVGASTGSTNTAIIIPSGADVIVTISNSAGGGGITTITTVPIVPTTPVAPPKTDDDFPGPSPIIQVKIPNPFFETGFVVDK